MKILLTGHSGFVGTHFQRIAGGIPLSDDGGEPLDLLERARIAAAVSEIAPEAVLHLAGQAFVPESFRDPHATFEVNVTGTLNLLLALKAAGFRGRMVYVSSSDVYGLVSPGDLPLREDRPPRPRSPYAASKVAAEALAYQWNCTESFEVVIARPFNHSGPGQSSNFVISNFAKQVAEIGAGRHEPVLRVGDIDVTRDFTDVRDIVRAYELLLQKGRGGEIYNICAGRETSVRAIRETLLRLAGLEARIEPDQERMRPSEQRRVAGSPAKLENETGWKAEIPLEQTLTDMLAYWEKEIE